MPKTVIFLIIGLFFGTGLGFLFAATGEMQHQGAGATDRSVHDHSAHDHTATGHDHSKRTDVTGPAPTIALVFHPDGPQSRNLEMQVENFAFDPEAVNEAHIEGRGHAHVYINDIKIARAYGPWIHLEALPIGTHQVRVTLNANDHSQLAVAGQPVEATATLVIE
ncbi:MAG: hypothetical protein AAF280_08155 [Pseudomonadota bacterium]